MDSLWTVLAFLLMLAGIAGSVLPLLPGPPLAYAGMLMLQLRGQPVFSVKFLIIWLVIVVIVQILDYVIPLYGTKKMGGSRYGMWGCALGLIAGFWFGPAGIIAGPFAGALAGELLHSGNTNHALRAAVGSFIGFLFSTLLKLITCSLMMWYAARALWM